MNLATWQQMELEKIGIQQHRYEEVEAALRARCVDRCKVAVTKRYEAMLKRRGKI